MMFKSINAFFARMEKDNTEIRQEVGQLIGAIGVYLGDIESTDKESKGDEDRLRRAMEKALKSKPFVKYMRKF